MKTKENRLIYKRNLTIKDSREDRRIPFRLQAINELWY